MLSDLISRGGPIMYVLVGCSVFSLAIVFERFVFWISELSKNPIAELRNALLAIRDGSKVELPSDDSMLSSVCELAKRGRKQQVVARLSQESDRAYERAVKNLSGLDTVISIAPLLGILGTVLGITKSFHALDFQHISSPGEVGHGLAEAMITTATGLAIAVPTLVVYNLLHSMAGRRALAIYRLSEDYAEGQGEDGESVEACG